MLGDKMDIHNVGGTPGGTRTFLLGMIMAVAGGYLLFQQVPQPKQVKNRVHLDLQPTERSRDEEVDRLRSEGAAVVADRRNPDGTGWVVMADPEGNEFCVERSVAEREG